MRPIYNDEIIHTGVKGMKWGHRKVQAIKTSIREKNRTNKNMLLHHVQSTKAQLSYVKNNPLKAVGGFDTNERKKLNDDVDRRVVESKKPKTKKTTQQHKEAGAKHVGNALKFIGANVMAANRNNQAMKISKMITPD